MLPMAINSEETQGLQGMHFLPPHSPQGMHVPPTTASSDVVLMTVMFLASLGSLSSGTGLLEPHPSFPKPECVK